ncbi:DNA-binding transcription factor [Lithospermum erythrorhizon]|uniref:DNA-binding transcription factor n=1 Tax=Lithospermum erythrorhizon TaxID=34254 RepID=A0AAV3PAZ8_LITER
MAPENNWLSFSLSPTDMFSNNTTSQPQMLQSNIKLPHDPQHYYFADDNIYANGLGDSNQQVRKSVATQSMNNMYNYTYMDPEMHHHTPVKLEDFLGGDAAAYSQTETNDSSLTNIYDQGGASSVAGAYFNGHHQDLNAIAGFQAFSANSCSEVEDSASVEKTQAMSGEFIGKSIESGTELAMAAVYSHCPPAGGGLSLGVDNYSNSQCNDKPIVSVDSNSESFKKVSDNFGQRTSIYRGVTKHRWTGRYEAHLWDNSCRREGQARKGRQGGYDKEDKAARSYDLAALKYWGPTATTNFQISNYTQELEDMKHMTKQEFIASLRRKSSGFSRGASKYRGVTRHHQQGRWQARIGRVSGNKDLYLGTFATEEEAAEAYDIAAIKFRGLNAVTNFEMNRYDVEAIMNSTLPIGSATKKTKFSLEAEQKPSLGILQAVQSNNSSINFSAIQHAPTIPYGVPYDSTPFYHHNLFQHLQSSNNSAPDASGAMSSLVSSMQPFPLQSPAEFFFWPNHQPY